MKIVECEILRGRLGSICFGPRARHTRIGKFQICLDPFVPSIFDLVDLDWSQCLGLGKRAVIDFEPPEYSSQTNSSALSFQNERIFGAAMKPDICGGGGDTAPAERVSCMEWARIRKAAGWLASQRGRPVIRRDGIPN